MLRIEDVGDVRILKIDNPPVNILQADFLVELDHALDSAVKEEKRVLVIMGAGKHFAAGGDLNEMSLMDKDGAREYSSIAHNVFLKMRELPLPILAAVNGYAFGGGTELAMACDFIIAGSDALFGQPETKYGITPGWGGTQNLPRIIGLPMARELIFTGRTVTATEAKEIGLVNTVCPTCQLRDHVLSVANDIAKNSFTAISEAKRAMNEGLAKDLCSGLLTEILYFTNCFGTPDQKEGMAAFFEKREPAFNRKQNKSN